MPLEIPEVVIDRLPVYFRLLSGLQGRGVSVVSSQELGDALGVTPAQIRKDLSYFGRFGKQGRGYSVDRLAEEGGYAGPEGDEHRWASWVCFEMAEPRAVIQAMATKRGWDR